MPDVFSLDVQNNGSSPLHGGLNVCYFEVVKNDWYNKCIHALLAVYSFAVEAATETQLALDSLTL